MTKATIVMKRGPMPTMKFEPSISASSNIELNDSPGTTPKTYSYRSSVWKKSKAHSCRIDTKMIYALAGYVQLNSTVSTAI